MLLKTKGNFVEATMSLKKIKLFLAHFLAGPFFVPNPA